VNRRASDFAAAMRTWLDAFDPGTVRSASVQRCGPWVITKLGATSDETARLLASDLGLTQARTPQKGRVWWREYLSTDDGVVIIVVGPTHSFEEPAGAVELPS
jgi:hypothetical protein